MNRSRLKRTESNFSSLPPVQCCYSSILTLPPCKSSWPGWCIRNRTFSILWLIQSFISINGTFNRFNDRLNIKYVIGNNVCSKVNDTFHLFLGYKHPCRGNFARLNRRFSKVCSSNRDSLYHRMATKWRIIFFDKLNGKSRLYIGKKEIKIFAEHCWISFETNLDFRLQEYKFNGYIKMAEDAKI